MKFYRVYALLLKYYYITFARLDRLFDIIYWPILDVVLWGLTSYFIEDISGVNLLSMFLGGVILWVFVWRSSQDIAVFVLEDFWSRNLYNLFASPITIFEHVFSIILFGLLRGIFSFFFLAFLAWIMYSFNVFGIGLLYITLFIPALTITGWAMGLLVTSLIMRYGSRIQVLAWSVVWIIQPFSCIFYPLSALPSWAQKIAVILPTTHVFEALRAVLNNGVVLVPNLVYAYVSSIVFLLVMAVFLKSSFKKAKKTGLFSRYE